MTPVLCLFVIVWVEVDVVDDDNICGREVYPQSPGTGRQDEDKYTLVLCIPVNQLLSVTKRIHQVKCNINQREQEAHRP